MVIMGRATKNLNYLESIEPIKKFLRDSTLTEKKLKNKLLDMDKIFPYLINRFKDNIQELTNFDLLTFLSKSTKERSEITQEWDINNINNLIFDAWKEETPETKANILMKWVNFSVEQEENKPKNKAKTSRNSFLSYMWSFQGLLAYLGRDFEANPKRLDQLKQESIKIGSEIEYSDVVELYSKLNEKYKIILRIMMYSGLNPIDILKLQPKDFQKVNGKTIKKLNNQKDDFYYVIKERTKTERKNVLFLLVFAESFYNELKNYFERTITINLDKTDKKNTKRIESLNNEIYYEKDIKGKPIGKPKNRYQVVYEAKEGKTIRFEGKYFWKHDLDMNIFNSITNTTTVSDNFKYFVKKHNLNEFLKPSKIRDLCFTMLKSTFTFEDANLYQLWTQHRVKDLVDRNYITDNLEKLINNNLPKIEAKVLIGSLKHTLGKAIEYKKKAEGINDNTEKITELEQDKQRLLSKLNKTDKTVNELKDTIGLLAKFVLGTEESSEVPTQYGYTEEERVELVKKISKLTKKD
ncbi:hypothetical protein LCGC14_1424760 [marine sediment metagenome]|uniref:Uncharacterized protein n=1 Tax=marine sediment metagenome TaxID=412755 RepID=A0A0F9M5S8_9ZZZZ